MSINKHYRLPPVIFFAVVTIHLKVRSHPLSDPSLQSLVHAILLDHGGEFIHEESSNVVDIFSSLENQLEKISGLTEHLFSGLSCGGGRRVCA